MGMPIHNPPGSEDSMDETNVTVPTDPEVMLSTCKNIDSKALDTTQPTKEVSPAGESNEPAPKSDKISTTVKSEVTQGCGDNPVDNAPKPWIYSSSTFLEDTAYDTEDTRKRNARFKYDFRIYDLPMDCPKWLAEKAGIEAILQYKFKNPLLLREAMYTHKGFMARLENGVLLKESNYSLAQHGDAVLRQVLVDCWFDLPGRKNARGRVGKTQDRLGQIISDKNLIRVADEHGITAYISKWYPRSTAKFACPKAIATTVEALIGAVERDCGQDQQKVRDVLTILLKVDLIDYQWSSANEQASTLIGQLGRGEDIDLITLLRLTLSVTLLAGKKVGKVVRGTGQIIATVLAPWKWPTLLSARVAGTGR